MVKTQEGCCDLMDCEHGILLFNWLVHSITDLLTGFHARKICSEIKVVVRRVNFKIVSTFDNSV